jgi:hypothetical protein
LLQKLEIRHPENHEVALRLAKASFNLTIDYSEKGEQQKVKEKYKLLQQLQDRYPQNLEVATNLAMASVNLITYYLKNGEPIKAEEKYFLLQELENRHSQNPELATILVKGCLILFQYHWQKGAMASALQKWGDMLKINLPLLSPEALAAFSTTGREWVMDLINMLQTSYDENQAAIFMATLLKLTAIGQISDNETVTENTAWAQGILNQLHENAG